MVARCARDAALALLVALTLSACVSSSPNDADFAKKAQKTVETVDAAVGTTRLGISALEQKQAFDPYLSVLMSEAEEDAGAARQSFDAVQPPGASSDEVRDQVHEVTDEAIDLLSEARIAIRREDHDAVLALDAPLAGVSERLKQLSEELG
jgi:hypothetical protein